jgi:hypothetical protein
MPRQAQIQVRRDSASNWAAENPTLAAGELGLETDTSLIKVGTGSTAWNSLSYLPVSDGSITTAKLSSSASIGLINQKSFIVQPAEPTTRPGGAELATGDVWISYTA